MTWQVVLLTVAWAAAVVLVLVGPALRPRGRRGDGGRHTPVRHEPPARRDRGRTR